MRWRVRKPWYNADMAPKSSRDLGKPHTGPADFNEGPAAADRFRSAISRLATLPKSAVTDPHPKPKRPKKK
jgi:hypothetical protein